MYIFYSDFLYRNGKRWRRNRSWYLEATGDKFFECIEKELRTSIPTYVKNILKMNGFYNAFMISKLVESKISEIEAFMRNDFADFMIPKDATLTVNDYLGVYSECQNKLKFLATQKLCSKLWQMRAEFITHQFRQSLWTNCRLKTSMKILKRKSFKSCLTVLFRGVVTNTKNKTTITTKQIKAHCSKKCVFNIITKINTA